MLPPSEKKQGLVTKVRRFTLGMATAPRSIAQYSPCRANQYRSPGSRPTLLEPRVKPLEGRIEGACTTNDVDPGDLSLVVQDLDFAPTDIEHRDAGSLEGRSHLPKQRFGGRHVADRRQTVAARQLERTCTSPSSRVGCSSSRCQSLP